MKNQGAQTAAPTRERRLDLYRTEVHDCAYLEGRLARTCFVDPEASIAGADYQILLERGFRRSGRFIYRPACPGCQACLPVRLPVNDFRPNRAQRRNWKRNAGEIVLVDTPARFRPDHAALYRRYLLNRHPDGGMAEDADDASYRRFLVEPWGGTTRFLEFHLGGRLLGVAVTDVLPRALSAVYTFFDPDAEARGPGTFAILSQIELARRLNRPWLYLGYWIRESPRMAYKAKFRPLHYRDEAGWRPLAGIGGQHGGDPDADAGQVSADCRYSSASP